MISELNGVGAKETHVRIKSRCFFSQWKANYLKNSGPHSQFVAFDIQCLENTNQGCNLPTEGTTTNNYKLFLLPDVDDEELAASDDLADPLDLVLGHQQVPHFSCHAVFVGGIFWLSV